MSSSRNQLHVKNTKELILEKSLEIIVSEGIHALTMRRLAKDIGMSAPNLYNYYVNKEQIYLTLMLKGFQSLSSMLEASVSSSSCPKERAERFMRSYVEFGLTNPSYYE